MKHASLFSGIGGFDLAAQWMGWENVLHCEWNEFGRKILNYYWPKAESYGDITKTDFSKHRGTIDILTGGFPCQPYSTSGRRKGKDDDRHLWPEMLRAIREIRPTYIVGENVRGLTNWNGGMVFNEVQAEMEAEGYQVAPFLLPSCAVNASHRRDRIWFVAYSHSSMLQNVGLQGSVCGGLHNEPSGQINTPNDLVRILEKTYGEDLCEFDGIPTKLDGITISRWRKESIRALGNSITPQVAFEIFKAIEATMNISPESRL